MKMHDVLTMSFTFILLFSGCSDGSGGSEDVSSDQPADLTLEGRDGGDLPGEEVNEDSPYEDVQVDAPDEEDDGILPAERGSCPDQPAAPRDLPVSEPVFGASFGEGWGGWRGSPLVTGGSGSYLIVDSAFGSASAYTLSGSRVWSNPINGRNYSGCIAANLDGDGDRWVVAGDNQGYVHVWDLEGSARSGWPVQVHGGADIRSLFSDDLDGNGIDEIVVFSSLTDSPPGEPNPNMYVFLPDGSVLAGWPHYRESDPYDANACIWCGGFSMNLAAGDLDGDGSAEIVFTQDRYSISVFHLDGSAVYASDAFSWCGEAGTLHWGEIRTYIPHTAEFSVVCDSHDSIIEFTYSPPLVTDLDFDGAAEVVAVGNIEMPVGNTTGSALAVYNADRSHKSGFSPYRVASGALVEPSYGYSLAPVAANFTGDRNLEIVVAHLDGFLALYSSSGEEIWRARYSDRAECDSTEPIVADLNGDNVPDILIIVHCQGDEDSTMMVFKSDGDVMLSFSLPFATIASPTIVDVDGDGELELLFQKFEGASNLALYDWPGTSDHCMLWYTTRANFNHSAVLP